MHAWGRVAILALMVVGSSLFSWTASSNSAGAPQNAADTGCTCHNAAPEPSVQVGLQGLPAAYEADETYDLTITAAGGATALPAVAQNLGGFALKVSAGLLLAADGIQVVGGTFATHSTDTNDQRSWLLQWVAPDVSGGVVNVSLAANTVNGDGTNAGGLDQWNRVTFAVPPATPASPNNMSAPPTESPEIVALPVVVAAMTLALAAIVSRRRS